LQSFLTQCGPQSAVQQQGAMVELQGHVMVNGTRFRIGPLAAPASHVHSHLDAIAATAVATAGQGRRSMEDSADSAQGGGAGVAGEPSRDDQQGGSGGSAAATGAAAGEAPRGAGCAQRSSAGGEGAQTPSQQAQGLEPTVNADGTIQGAEADFHVAQPEENPSVLDGNYFRGKAWNDVVRRPNDPVGPRQLAPRERVDVGDRNAAAAAGSRAGERVNPLSQERGHEMGGYEREAWIDPRRNVTEVVGGGGGQRKAPPPTPAELEASVMFETAGGLGPKITNTHLMGGERVKELDFFVASVETPSVIVRPPDPSNAVTQLALRSRVAVSGEREGVAELFVQKEHLAPDGVSVPPQVSAVGTALRFIVHTCCGPKLLNLPAAKLSQVRFTYFATMRADASVAATSEVDGCTYFNAMVLQQQQCVDVATLLPLVVGSGDAAEVSWNEWRGWIRSTTPQAAIGEAGSGLEALQRRTWRYWLERCAMALGHGPPTGLYDASVRRRFKAFMAQQIAL